MFGYKEEGLIKLPERGKSRKKRNLSYKQVTSLFIQNISYHCVFLYVLSN